MSKPLPRPWPLGAGNPHVGGFALVVFSRARTRPGDVSMVLGSRLWNHPVEVGGRGPQFVCGWVVGLNLLRWVLT